jgi:nitroreductase
MPVHGDPQDPNTRLKGLRHTRRFLDKPVPLAVIDDLLAAAKAVGAEGRPPARFMVVDDLETKDELTTAGTFTGGMAGAAVVIVAIQQGDEVRSGTNLEGRIADAVMLEANHHGLGSAYGWFTTREAQEHVRTILGIPAGGRVLVGVAVGYVDDEPKPAGSSLQRVLASLEGLSGNRDRQNRG